MVLWFWILFSALQATDQAVVWEYFESQSKIFLRFLVGITTIDSVAKLKQLTWVMVLSLGYVGL